jgi:hypothetical protein
MTLDQQQRELETLDRDADDIAAFVAGLDTWRLQMIGTVINDELSLRHEGKPCDRARLH